MYYGDFGFDKTLKYSRRSNLFKYSIYVGKHFKSGIYFGTPFTMKSFRTTCATILKLHNRYHLLISLFDVFPYPFKHLLRTYFINQPKHIVNRKVNFKSKFQWTDSVSLSTVLLLVLLQIQLLFPLERQPVRRPTSQPVWLAAFQSACQHHLTPWCYTSRLHTSQKITSNAYQFLMRIFSLVNACLLLSCEERRLLQFNRQIRSLR